MRIDTKTIALVGLTIIAIADMLTIKDSSVLVGCVTGISGVLIAHVGTQNQTKTP
jgi:hypothetical protein